LSFFFVFSSFSALQLMKSPATYKYTSEHWDEVIQPSPVLFQFNLREIWRYKDLIALLVRRDFVTVYKQSILGPLWFFLQPALTTAMFVIIFSRVARIPTNNCDPILFYLSGITLWNYFSEVFLKTSNTFISNASIFGKVYFPRVIIPISVVLSHLIKFGIQTILLVIVMCYQSIFDGFSWHFNGHIFFVPLLLLITATLGMGLGIFFSALTTKYRDISFLLAFGIQLLMYASPVIYPLQFVSGTLRKILELNPLSSLIEFFRMAVLGEGDFSVSVLIYPGLFSLCALFIGLVAFNRTERNFMDTV
jgi:lipopolysaccharide transport system permease protein